MRIIKTACPVCNHDIEDENMTPEEDYAFCTICQKEFSFTDFFIVPDTGKQETTRFSGLYQPKRTWRHEKRDETIIGAVTYNFMGLFFLIPVIVSVSLAIFCFFFNGGFSIGNIVSGFFILFFAFPFGFCGLVILINKVELVIGKETYIIETQGIWKTKRVFDWNSVVKIYDKTIKVSKKRETFIIIKLAEKTVKNHNGKLTNEISFGGALKKKQKQFLLNALQYYHNKKRN